MGDVGNPVIDHTLWFQRVRLALELSRHDVVEIVRLGGLTVSSSRADGWARGIVPTIVGRV